MGRIRKPTKRRGRAGGSLPDIKGMIAMLKSLYSPAQLREIVDGLGLPVDDHAGSGCNFSQNDGRKE